MSHYVALHDRRLEGGVPQRPNLTILNTDAHTSLHSAFLQIKNVARKQKIGALFVLCHGSSGSNVNAGVCMDAGGRGLKLGREKLVHENVGMWRAIAKMVNSIVVYACAAGDTQPGNEATNADGRYLMGALAIYTQAEVFAADKIQWYTTYNDASNGRFDFGDWEGQLWDFPPTGLAPTPVLNAPIELADVMAGTVR